MMEARGSGEMVCVCCCVLGRQGRTDRAAFEERPEKGKGAGHESVRAKGLKQREEQMRIYELRMGLASWRCGKKGECWNTAGWCG